MSAPTTEHEAALNSLLTPREQKLILFGLLTLEDLPVINYPVVAQRMGMSNPRSVSNAWAIIKKKIRDFDTANKVPSTATASAAQTPATPVNGKGGRKRAAASIAGGSEDDIGTPTPAKRGPGRPKKVLSSPSTPASMASVMTADTPTKSGPRGRGRPKRTAAIAAQRTIVEEETETAALAAAGTAVEENAEEAIGAEDLAEISAMIKQEKVSDDEELATISTRQKKRAAAISDDEEDDDEEEDDCTYIKREPGVDSPEVGAI
ncbi:hypothetical protein QBC43DRAFT_334235 [Cladorrhinum sp. PSN259]|nr:hypothetical protein QBC43DRAFT_334235 [Cladorrhinum sp. PSN259]